MARKKTENVTPKIDEGKDQIEDINVEVVDKKQKNKKDPKEEIKSEETKVEVTKVEETKVEVIPVTPNDEDKNEEQEIPAKVLSILEMHNNYKELYVDKNDCVYDPKTFNEDMNPKATLYINPYFKK